MLVHSPEGAQIRVRGIRAENREAASAAAGQRCALNLTGRKFEKDQVKRGDWITAPGVHAPTRRFDARLRLLAQESRALKHWTPVHVHIGAANVTGRVGLLEDKALAPGETALAQLILDTPVGALYADRFIIRDQSALRTLGGGHVIDPAPPKRGARTPARLRQLGLMDHSEPGVALAALVAESQSGLDLGGFARARNLTGAEARDLWQRTGLVAVKCGETQFGLSPERWDDVKTSIESQIAEHQRLHADSAGATFDEILRLTKDAGRRLLARAAMAALIEAGRVLRYGQLVHLPGHEVKLSDTDEARWLQIGHVMEAAGYDQPRVTELAAKLEIQPEALLPLLSKLAQIGRLRRVSKAYFLLPGAVSRLAEAAKLSAQAHPEQLLTIGHYREATKISRHMVMPLMEFFDKIGFTRRLKDGRQIRSDWSEPDHSPQRR